MENTFDVTINANGGTIDTFTPHTEEADQWFDENLDGQNTWIGKSLAVEHRYSENLAFGLLDAGLKVGSTNGWRLVQDERGLLGWHLESPPRKAA